MILKIDFVIVSIERLRRALSWYDGVNSQGSNLVPIYVLSHFQQKNGDDHPFSTTAISQFHELRSIHNP